MDLNYIKKLLTQVQSGDVSIDSAMGQMQQLPFSDLGFATVDHHRSMRQGLPEVIFAPPKTPEQIVAIARDLLAHQSNVLITRISPEQARLLQQQVPTVSYNEMARTATVRVQPVAQREQRIVIVTAGTGDLPVAEEAMETLGMTGFAPVRIADVGVAGIHRLLAHRDTLLAAEAVIVVAGMEGALPSVIGGMVSCPVIAVPTSVGYGAHLGGLTPLMAMLSSCAAGVVVVNIDNGFGAAMAIHRMFSPVNAHGGVSHGADEPGSPTSENTEQPVDSHHMPVGNSPAAHSPSVGRNSAPESTVGEALVLEANTDDMTGELASHLIDRLMAAGAWDAWITPTTTKKGRPGWVVSAMCDKSQAGPLRDVILGDSTSIGVRNYTVRRSMLSRKQVVVSTRFGSVPVKVSQGPATQEHVKPEFDVCARLAQEHNVSARVVQREAICAYEQQR